jgi:hypothetical protein
LPVRGWRAISGACSRDLLRWFGFLPPVGIVDCGGCFVRTMAVGYSWRACDFAGSWYYLINCKISSIDRIDRINLQSMSCLGLDFSGMHRLDPIVNRMVSILKMHYSASLSIAMSPRRCLFIW